MPIWFELMVLLLFTYAMGLGIGWGLWGRSGTAPEPDEVSDTPKG
ncbi:hypothetical protein [Parerythrobacter jejuensis]|nr:hypothetical protein [Parerythrobacter jejuensis]